MPPKAFCWTHLGCIRTKFLKSWFHVIDDYRLKYFSSAGLPWSPASNSLTHHECSQLTSTSRIKVSLWLESASFTENLDESSASVKKRCKKYLGQVATISCNVSQRVSRKGCMKDNSLKFISSSWLWLRSCFWLWARLRDSISSIIKNDWTIISPGQNCFPTSLTRLISYNFY